jgi:hypothetical protein
MSEDRRWKDENPEYWAEKAEELMVTIAATILNAVAGLPVPLATKRAYEIFDEISEESWARCERRSGRYSEKSSGE